MALFTAPSLVVFALFFAAPFSYFFVVSFWRIRLFRMTPDFTLDNYAGVFGNYLYPLVFTFTIAFVIALLTATLAFAIAYLIRFAAGRWCRSSKPRRPPNSWHFSPPGEVISENGV